MEIFTLWCDDIYLGAFSTARLAIKAAYESLHQDIFPETRGIKPSDLRILTTAYNRSDWPKMQAIAGEVLGWQYQIKRESLDDGNGPVEVELVSGLGYLDAALEVPK